MINLTTVLKGSFVYYGEEIAAFVLISNTDGYWGDRFYIKIQWDQ